mmetsp:Transcript_67234/g.119741  ORF Transcript_67234/g.119741 Transcript_67234/m.119741 type:complete len:178 (-) Transcript_67234:33-566(-)
MEEAGAAEAAELAALLAHLHGRAADLESKALEVPDEVPAVDSPPFLVIVQTMTGEELLEPITASIGVAALRERLFTEARPVEEVHRPKLFLDSRELRDGEILDATSDTGLPEDTWPLIVTVIWQMDPLAEKWKELAQKHEELDLEGEFESRADMQKRLKTVCAELRNQTEAMLRSKA